MAIKLENCIGCGAPVATSDGPMHAYLGASPGCWAVFGELLERDYSDAAYFASHALIVDSYAVQHPGQAERRTIQSLAVHLVALHAKLELGYPAQRLVHIRRSVAKQGNHHWLDPPTDRYDLTVLDVLEARNAQEHAILALRWAEHTWQAWSKHHSTVRLWAQAAIAD